MELYTAYASAERSTEEEIAIDVEKFRQLDLIRHILNLLPDLMLILNKNRQVVFINRALVNLMGGEAKINSIYGQRPGELFKCIHSTESEGGCGTTEFCSECGAVNSILSAQKGDASLKECRINSQDDHKAFDLRVYATPLFFFENTYTLFVISDIADEKRRKVLEKIFFHDILNSAGSIRGISQILKEAEDNVRDEFVQMLDRVSDTLIDEITAQRELVYAENGDLAVKFVPLNSLEVLTSVKEHYDNHEVCAAKEILISTECKSIEFVSDKVLLGRVLGNLCKNALEATPSYGKIEMGFSAFDEKIQFWIKNNGVIPRDIQLQLFQRSFSTKGSGRGVGTYSIKLLTEKYLNGVVSFISDEGSGTIFYIELPL